MYERLRKIRIERGFSNPKGICELLELSTNSAYYKKETGDIKFSLEEAVKLAKFFKMPIEKLFFIDELSEMES